MYEISVNVPDSATSLVATIGVASTQSAVLNTTHATGLPCLLSPSVDCYVRQGPNPTALNNGTDMLLRGGQTYRTLIGLNNKLALIAVASAGTMSITPNA